MSRARHAGKRRGASGAHRHHRAHSGPEFDKLIPLIEEVRRLNLPVPVLNVAERAAEFVAVRANLA